MRSVSYEQNPVYFGLMLTRTLKLKCRSVKLAKKAKTHKPKKHWNHIKYPFTWNGEEYLLFPIIKKIHSGQSTG